jgi:hypothetical protein
MHRTQTIQYNNRPAYADVYGVTDDQDYYVQDHQPVQSAGYPWDYTHASSSSTLYSPDTVGDSCNYQQPVHYSVCRPLQSRFVTDTAQYDVERDNAAPVVNSNNLGSNSYASASPQGFTEQHTTTEHRWTYQDTPQSSADGRYPGPSLHYGPVAPPEPYLHNDPAATQQSFAMHDPVVSLTFLPFQYLRDVNRDFIAPI